MIFFLLSTESKPALSPIHSPIQWVPGGGDFLGGKTAGREADHSSPSSVEAKNGGNLSPFPHIPL
jgi:hypothetical protein